MNGDLRNAGGSHRTFIIFAVLHFLCCGVPLLLLSGVSLAFLAPLWPVWGGILAALGVVGFVWYIKRGCPTCPRNEGRCVHRSTKATSATGQHHAATSRDRSSRG